jgi:hypothetical protein
MQHGHARAWPGWRGLALPLGARRPQTPASRNGPLVEWSLTAGLCAVGTIARRCASPPARLGGSSGRQFPAPGSLAAADCRDIVFVLGQRKVILAGPRQGQASLRSVRQRTLDMALLRQD